MRRAPVHLAAGLALAALAAVGIVLGCDRATAPSPERFVLDANSRSSWRAYYARLLRPAYVRHARTGMELERLRRYCPAPMAPLGIDKVTGGYVCFTPGRKSERAGRILCLEIGMGLVAVRHAEVECRVGAASSREGLYRGA